MVSPASAGRRGLCRERQLAAHDVDGQTGAGRGLRRDDAARQHRFDGPLDISLERTRAVDGVVGVRDDVLLRRIGQDAA